MDHRSPSTILVYSGGATYQFEFLPDVGDEVLEVVKLIVREVRLVVLEQLLRLEHQRHDRLLVLHDVVIQSL